MLIRELILTHKRNFTQNQFAKSGHFSLKLRCVYNTLVNVERNEFSTPMDTRSP